MERWLSCSQKLVATSKGILGLIKWLWKVKLLATMPGTRAQYLEHMW